MTEQPETPDRDPLLEALSRQAARREAAQQERRTILSQTVHLGVLGLVFVLPVVLGGYVGRWLDIGRSGYSFAWTLGLLLGGVVLGAVNVYLTVRRRS